MKTTELKPLEYKMTLQERIDEIQKKLNELNALVKKEKPGYWIPDHGDSYYTYDGCNYGGIGAFWRDDVEDIRRLSQHRVLKSAETRNRIVRVQRILDQWNCKNMAQLDYSEDIKQSKWMIRLASIYDKGYEISGPLSHVHYTLGFFLTREEAENCIEEIGEEEMTFYARHMLGLLTEDEL